MRRRTGLAMLVAMLLLSSAGALSEVVEAELTIGRGEVNFTGKTVEALTVSGGIPGPTLEFREGDVARIRVRNDLDVAASVHWHGLLVPPGRMGCRS